jgi:DNA-binding response OmpR family regulator
MADGPTILIVEDDLVLKNLLSQELAQKYALSFASDGEEALTLLLLDLVIPKLSGFDVLERIRARTDVLKSAPVIVLSNLGQADDRMRAMKAGANQYLVKAEVSVEEIVGAVAHILPPTPHP